MQDATEFGKFIRELIAKNNLRQGQLAKELGVSESILSNYITGKNIPEMAFLAKCVDRFNLKGKELKDLYAKAISSTIQCNQKIVLDTRFFSGDRLEPLFQIITVLMLYSDKQSLPVLLKTNPSLLSNLIASVKNSFDAMDTDSYLELIRPPE